MQRRQNDIEPDRDELRLSLDAQKRRLELSPPVEYHGTMDRLPVAVVIPTHGRREGLLNTLRSVLHARCADQISRFLIVENGTSLISQSLLDMEFRDSRIACLWSEQSNKSAALNLALQDTGRDPYIIFFDDDVLLDEGCIASYLGAFERFPGAHYFGGPTQSVLPRRLHPAILNLMPTCVRGHDYRKELGFTGRDLFCVGFNWAARAQDLLDVGGFDPRFGPGSRTGAAGQEANMQLRLNGISGCSGIWVPGARVTHVLDADRGTLKWWFHRKIRGGVFLGLTPRLLGHQILNFFRAEAGYLLRNEPTLKGCCLRMLYRTVGSFAVLLGILKVLWLRARGDMSTPAGLPESPLQPFAEKKDGPASGRSRS
ncbi:MAG: glycosyltransferase family 2 protein [Chloroflexota bacterium]